MDEKAIAYYRRLLKEDFPNARELDNPSVFIEAVGEHLINCGNTGNYMRLYLRLDDDRITDIAYLCSCEPAANVAVEILCTLMKGKTLEEALDLTEEPFFLLLGSRDEKFLKKTVGLLALLKEGIARHRSLPGSQGTAARVGDGQGGKISWDGTLST